MVSCTCVCVFMYLCMNVCSPIKSHPRTNSVEDSDSYVAVKIIPGTERRVRMGGTFSYSGGPEFNSWPGDGLP